jgi:hypothetical protein
MQRENIFAGFWWSDDTLLAWPGPLAAVSYPSDIKLSDKHVIATWIIFFIVLLLEYSENLYFSVVVKWSFRTVYFDL